MAVVLLVLAIVHGEPLQRPASILLIAMPVFAACSANAVMKVRQSRRMSLSSKWERWRAQALFSILPAAATALIVRGVHQRDARTIIAGTALAAIYVLSLLKRRSASDTKHS